jgi:hypothetical protein
MQIVIDIPKDEYNIAKYGQYGNINVDVVRKAIAKGTPLPEGHGKLFDVNDLLDRIGLEDNESNRDENVGEIVTLEDFDYIPTIIPADTENGGEE